MPGPLAAIATAATPVIGGIGSAFLQRNWALKDWHRTNAYNHPKEQIKRLQEAGLPSAALFSGGVGSQSDQPQATNVDPTLGTAKGIENYMQTKMQQKQMELLDEQILKTRYEANLAGTNANKADLEYKWLSQNTDSNILNPALVRNNMFDNLDMQKKMNELKNTFQEYENRIKAVVTDVEESLNKGGVQKQTAIQQLMKLYSDLKIQGQIINRGKAMDALVMQLEKGGMSVVEAFFHSLLTGMMGTKSFTR